MKTALSYIALAILGAAMADFLIILWMALAINAGLDVPYIPFWADQAQAIINLVQ